MRPIPPLPYAQPPRRTPGFRDDVLASVDAACRTVGWLAIAAASLFLLLATYRMGEFLHLASIGAIQ